MEDLSERTNEMNDFFASVDTILTGRKTYEKGLEMSGGENGGFGDPIMSYVFTRTPRVSSSKNLRFVSKDIGEFVADLKNQGGKNIYLMGGGELARTFFEEGLIDELVLGIQAKIIGSGISLFLPHKRQTDLELIDVKTRRSGSVRISYSVKR